MKRRIPTTCLAFTLGTLALLARGQNLAPLSPPSTVEQAAGQQSNFPELTLEQAVEKAKLVALTGAASSAVSLLGLT